MPVAELSLRVARNRRWWCHHCHNRWCCCNCCHHLCHQGPNSCNQNILLRRHRVRNYNQTTPSNTLPVPRPPTADTTTALTRLFHACALSPTSMPAWIAGCKWTGKVGGPTSSSPDITVNPTAKPCTAHTFHYDGSCVHPSYSLALLALARMHRSACQATHSAFPHTHTHTRARAHFSLRSYDHHPIRLRHVKHA